MNLYSASLWAILFLSSIDEHVSNLQSNDHRIRDEAQYQLEQLGEQARPVLEKAATSLEPEVKLRAQTILKKLDIERIWAYSMKPDIESAVAGPFRLKLLTAKRNFSDELDYSSNKSSITHDLNFNANLKVHDSLKLISEKLTKIEAFVDDKDIAYALPARTWNFPVRYPLYNYDPNGDFYLTTSFKIKPTVAKKIDVLKVYWEMYAIGESKTLKLEVKNHKTADENLEIEYINEKELVLSSSTIFNGLTDNLNREITIDVISETEIEKNVMVVFSLENSVQATLSHKVKNPKIIQVNYHPLRSFKTFVFEFKDVKLPNSPL